MHILSNITYNLKMVEFPGNFVGPLVCKKMSDTINSKSSHLQIVNLEDNKLTNECGEMIFKAARYSKELKILNLSKNMLCDKIS